MGCKCQKCGKYYKVDLIICDNLWEKIKPINKSIGSGLLCGSCIMNKIEKISNYTIYYLKK